MLLLFPDGSSFATGSTPYDYRPATHGEMVKRIIIQIEIEGITTEAALDTGGLFLLCTPTIAKLLNFDPRNALPSPVKSIGLRGATIYGDVFPVNLRLPADRGRSLDIEVMAFVPKESKNDWEDFPCVLGLHGCLEKLHFAVDPLNSHFYFGSFPEEEQVL
jgi:hypothetical protein